MRLKREKCAFLLKSVSYLGHAISEEYLHTVESKVKAVVEAPDPRNISELRSFLGTVKYYEKFLPNLATTLSPLHRLLRQTRALALGTKTEKAVRNVKNLLKPRSQTSSQQLRSLTSQQQRNPIWNELNQKLRLSMICLTPHRLSGDLAGQVIHLMGLKNRDFSLGFCIVSYGYG